MEVAWDRGDDDFDVAVGFHTHSGTLVREFFKHGKRRYAVQMGAYKVRDKFGDELGFTSVKNTGAGAMVATPEGDVSFFQDLETAAEFLTYLRERQFAP
jgi:hypothetical protein